MTILKNTIQDALKYIEEDVAVRRFVGRVFFINNLKDYYSFVDKLSEKADITIRLSDELFCKGQDTVPNLRTLIDFLDQNKDKNVLIPNLAEYLRIGEFVERNVAGIYSILNRQVHSKQRVWMPFLGAKGLFQSVVGQLVDERFDDAIIEIDGKTDEFNVTVYARRFATQLTNIDAIGIRAWLQLWDDHDAQSGMSYATRQIKQIKASDGNYAIKVVDDAFDFLRERVKDDDIKLSRHLGSDAQWLFLANAAGAKCSIEQAILRSLNMYQFEPKNIISQWYGMDEFRRWAFFLWYKLGLNKYTDYVSFSVAHCVNEQDLPDSLENSIFECLGNDNFEEWTAQRSEILGAMSYQQPSEKFVDNLRRIEDNRTKLKILTCNTVAEKSLIVEIVSGALRMGASIDEFKHILEKKYPDLLLYCRPSMYLTGDVEEYLEQYKYHKISDTFSSQLSERAGKVDCEQFKTRTTQLYSLQKQDPSRHFVWVDGMGIEWIDMLLEKIKIIDPMVSVLNVGIGTAMLPTITRVNMENADPATISEKKIDDLDALSHIKDKRDCNYYSIIAKQFDLIGEIAQHIVIAINAHPEVEVVVTADHGMSRMAAKGFHSTQGVDVPHGATVSNYGRYCEFAGSESLPRLANTKPRGAVLAFCTHNHFISSGYAPGEIHGGAAPEELLVPIIHFAKRHYTFNVRDKIDYQITSPVVSVNHEGNSILTVMTTEPASSLYVDIEGVLIKGETLDNIHWSIILKGLVAGNNYEISIYPNNKAVQGKETIFVRRQGIVVDDDF